MATKLKYHKSTIKLPLAQNVIPVINGISKLINQAKYMLEEQKFTSILLLAYHNTSAKAILLSKQLKQKYPKLHEITIIKTIEKFYHYEPIEEGLIDVNISQKIPSIIIKLTFNPTQQDIASPGYQRCLYDEKTQNKNPQLRELYEISYENDNNQEEHQDDELIWQQIDDDQDQYQIEDDQFAKIEDERNYKSEGDFTYYLDKQIRQHIDIYRQDHQNQIHQFIQIQSDDQNNVQLFENQQQIQFQQNDSKQLEKQEYMNYSHKFNHYTEPDDDGFEEIRLPGYKQNQIQQQQTFDDFQQQPQTNDPNNLKNIQFQQNFSPSCINEANQSKFLNNQLDDAEKVSYNSSQFKKKNYEISNEFERETTNQNNFENIDDRLNRDNIDYKNNREDRNYKNNRDKRYYQNNRDTRDNRDKRDNRDDRDYKNYRNNRGKRDNRNNRDKGDIRNNRDNRDNKNNRDNRNNRDNIDNRNNRDNRDNRDKIDNIVNRDNWDDENYNDNIYNRDHRDNNKNQDQRNYKNSRNQWDKFDNRQYKNTRDNFMDDRDSSSEDDLSDEEISEQDSNDDEELQYNSNRRKHQHNPFLHPRTIIQNEISEYKDKRKDIIFFQN
ncbi:unnamed protein product [Paramecium pentaurelia]|uniref:DNA/RNA-binding protein Alba-like domain-containing protein n=1 Tax=Paramecium pentaurelia TaxID=43138 RepID=A0A8S1UKB3_9CILI|nr:unnamed protein product [Paramecium pentaurelia]